MRRRPRAVGGQAAHVTAISRRRRPRGRCSGDLAFGNVALLLLGLTSARGQPAGSASARSAPSSLGSASAPVVLPLIGEAFGELGHAARLILGASGAIVTLAVDSASDTSAITCTPCPVCEPPRWAGLNCSQGGGCESLACADPACPTGCQGEGICEAGAQDSLAGTHFVLDRVAPPASPARLTPLALECISASPDAALAAGVDGVLGLNGGAHSIVATLRRSSPNLANAYTLCTAPSGGTLVLGGREAGARREAASVTASLDPGAGSSPALRLVGLAVGGSPQEAAAAFSQAASRDAAAAAPRPADPGSAASRPLPPLPALARVRRTVPLAIGAGTDAARLFAQLPPGVGARSRSRAPGRRRLALLSDWSAVPALLDSASSLIHVPAGLADAAHDQLVAACERRAAASPTGAGGARTCARTTHDLPARPPLAPAAATAAAPAGTVALRCVDVAEAAGPANASAGAPCAGFDATALVPPVHIVAEEVTWTLAPWQVAFAGAPEAAPEGGACVQRLCLAVTDAVPSEPRGAAVLGAAALQNFAVSMDHLTGSATLSVAQCAEGAPPCPECGLLATRWAPGTTTVLAVALGILAFAACFTFAVVAVARRGCQEARRAGKGGALEMPGIMGRRPGGWAAVPVHARRGAGGDRVGGAEDAASLRSADSLAGGEGKDEDIESALSTLRPSSASSSDPLVGDAAARPVGGGHGDGDDHHQDVRALPASPPPDGRARGGDGDESQDADAAFLARPRQ